MSCDNKDHHIDSLIPIVDSRGAFVLCSGTVEENTSTPSAIAYIDYNGSSVQQDIFQKRSGRQLGSTATDVLVYGEKLYIAVPGDNLIEVVNRRTWESVRQVTLNSALSIASSANQLLAAADGFLYVACDSCVAAIDTLNFASRRTYALKTSPVAIAVAKGTLYVCCNGRSSERPTIETIDLLTDSTTTITSSLLTRPQAIVAAWPHMFVLDQGDGTNASSIHRVSANGNVSTVVRPAVSMSVSGTKLYTCNVSPASCSVYDLQTTSQSTFTTDITGTPCLIAADPVTNHIFLVSRISSAQSADANIATQSANVVEYNAQGKKLNTYDIPANPKAIMFDVGLQYVEY